MKSPLFLVLYNNLWYHVVIMITKLKFKNVEIKNNIFLAPMAGYTDVGFRVLAKKYGAGLTFTEMVSAKALEMGSVKTENLLVSTPEETPIAVQLFGNDERAFVSAIKSGKLDKFDIIDINMGCPAPKIVGNKEGSFLMTEIDHAKEIIEACVNVTDKPVSVKFRSGFDEDHIVAVEFAKMCEEAGATFITLHPRTKTQGYSGNANWDLIKKVTNAVKIPVIASGDVCTCADVKYLTEICGASGVMIGRACLGNPEIFEELTTGKKRKLELVDKLDQIQTHIEILRKFFDEKFVYMNMKKHILSYLRDFDGVSALRERICLCTSLEEMLKIIKDRVN